MIEEKIQKRIETLQSQRGQIVSAIAESDRQRAQLNQNLLMHDGAIAELSALLKAEGESPNEPEKE